MKFYSTLFVFHKFYLYAVQKRMISWHICLLQKKLYWNVMYRFKNVAPCGRMKFRSTNTSGVREKFQKDPCPVWKPLLQVTKTKAEFHEMLHGWCLNTDSNDFITTFMCTKIKVWHFQPKFLCPELEITNSVRNNIKEIQHQTNTVFERNDS